MEYIRVVSCNFQIVHDDLGKGMFSIKITKILFPQIPEIPEPGKCPVKERTMALGQRP